jgi:ArsR family transcriptional regulator, arsenate/arsenite/antimonite-responsive transcriptional repressor
MDTDALECLSDARRVAILESLADGQLCLCDISSAVGISDALASHHVKRLRESGLVIAERRGVWLHCRLAPDALASLAGDLTALAERARAAEGVGGSECCPAPTGEGS